MTVLNEKARYSGDFIMSEGPNHISRDAIVIASGQGKLSAGSVVGKVTATGKWKLVTVAAADGSQNAAGVIIYDVDATSADAEVAAIVRLAEVNVNCLVFGADVDQASEKQAVYDDLAAVNIIVR